MDAAPVPALDPGALELLDARSSAALFGPGARAARLGVLGEGSCFFHSILAAAQGAEYLALPRRERQKRALALRCSFQKSFRARDDLRAGREAEFERLHEDFCSLTSDAQEPQIRHVMRELGANIIFVDANGRRVYCGVHGDPFRQPTVVVLWVMRQHFEPLLLVEGETPASVRLRGVFDPRDAADRARLEHLLETYARQCAMNWRAFFNEA